MKTVILVAAHKPYRMPEDPVYMPLHVGREGKAGFGYTGDDTGEHISGKNANYCELTGLYWAWKNLECDVLGMAHYRRHFAKKRSRKPSWDNLISQAEIEALLQNADAILPTPRNYMIETTYQQYAHAHHAQDLDKTRAILAERWPQYLKKYDEVMARTWGHRFNMFIMKRETADAYCEWLFSVLSELEKRLDISAYSANDARVFGFVAERLIDVWLEHNGLRTCDAPVMFMERQNWLKKGGAFIWRKLRAGLPGKRRT
ncbi:MAG: DUF4422 domain-containing protein [Clostridia bacterium]|nr:DUF4422 domain-containing protein [Clostridia bacterium]